MKISYTLALLLLAYVSGVAQSPLPLEYSYDASGNRTSRKVLTLSGKSAVQKSAFSDSIASLPYYAESLGELRMRVYPNPTREKVTLSISNYNDLESCAVRVYDMRSRLLQEHTVTRSDTEIDLSGFPSGIYLLELRMNTETTVWKIIKD